MKITLTLDAGLSFQGVGYVSPEQFELVFEDSDGDEVRFVAVTEDLAQVAQELERAVQALGMCCKGEW